MSRKKFEQDMREKDDKWKADLRSQLKKLENERNLLVATAKAKDLGRENRARLDAEREALELLKLGYVKVETLRHLILADYEVNASPTLDIAKFTLRLHSSDPMEGALRDAIVAKDKPKFATGGLVGDFKWDFPSYYSRGGIL